VLLGVPQPMMRSGTRQAALSRFMMQSFESSCKASVVLYGSNRLVNE